MIVSLTDPGGPMTDVLARAGATKDEQFSAWMAARHALLKRRAQLLTGDGASADDLVQETLAKLYLAWNRVKDRDSLDAYARRIMLNEFNSGWRRPWRRRERTTDVVPDRAVHDRPDDGSRGEMWRFVQTLPPKQRAVIVLRYYEELSEVEIADALGISTGTVKSQASRALASLRARAPEVLGTRSAPHPSPFAPHPSTDPDHAADSKEEGR